jgi:hypothetical protein
VFGFDLSHGCSEYSTQLNAARIKVLRAQDGVVGEMKEDAGKSLLRVTKDATAYRKVLKGLIVQVITTKSPHTLYIGLSSIIHIYIDANESIYIIMSRFISIYMNVNNARKSYIVKRREYLAIHAHFGSEKRFRDH